MSEVKATNPKDAIGATKVPMGLVPDTVMIEASMAFLEGALKYGKMNWRASEIKTSIYHDALMRHLTLWWNGENEDPDTKVKHLASIIACAGILLDAKMFGSLIDDRPPAANMRALLDARKDIQMPHLKNLFKDHDPKHWTIADVRPVRIMDPDAL
jgi:hypothetical protein